MNEQQIEIASRKLCELRGSDPDETVQNTDVPRWRYISDLIVSHSRLNQSIRFALDQTREDDQLSIDDRLKEVFHEGFVLSHNAEEGFRILDLLDGSTVASGPMIQDALDVWDSLA